MSFLDIIPLFARYLWTTHEQIPKACALRVLPLSHRQLPVLDPCPSFPSSHMQNSPFSPYLDVSDPAAYHQHRRPSAATVGHFYSLPSSSHSFASALLCRMPTNFSQASSGLWKCSKFSVCPNPYSPFLPL